MFKHERKTLEIQVVCDGIPFPVNHLIFGMDIACKVTTALLKKKQDFIMRLSFR